MSATTFEYAVRDRGGKVVTGRMDADSEAAVAGKLRGMGYAPISISQTNAGMKKELSLPSFNKRVKLKDLAIFARQFATMINSGLSLLRALSILEEQTDNKEFARVISEVRLDVEQGTALSTAMGRHTEVFPPLMVNMTRAGEVGGFLDTVLLQVADSFESEVKLHGKIKAAMTYPVAVLIMAIMMTIGMLIFVVPTFENLFAQLGGELPAPTRMLVLMSALLKVGLLPLIIVMVGASVWWRKVKSTEKVRNIVDPMKLKVPVFGGLFQKIALARFTGNLGTMVKSGVPILQALDIVADTSGNVVIARAVRDVQSSVRRGESLAGPLSEHPVFPAMVVQMLSVGEDTGALDTMLAKISEFYRSEVEATTASLTSLIEPLMIAFLGGIVGSMIIALYLPIFKVFDLVGGQTGQ
ncbi:MAG: type II secretion system F family protein [Actinobacteria bacterium]|nr:type II secretion system F family protein [Actinomycetota bacterium]